MAALSNSTNPGNVWNKGHLLPHAAREHADRSALNTFTPRLERGRASNFAGDSATAEKLALQHAHP